MEDENTTGINEGIVSWYIRHFPFIYRTMTRGHGLLESYLGVKLLESYAEYSIKTGDYEPGRVLGAISIYLIAEGIVDIVTGERKHHLTSSILEKVGLKKISKQISAPRSSHLDDVIKNGGELI